MTPCPRDWLLSKFLGSSCALKVKDSLALKDDFHLNLLPLGIKSTENERPLVGLEQLRLQTVCTGNPLVTLKKFLL